MASAFCDPSFMASRFKGYIQCSKVEARARPGFIPNLLKETPQFGVLKSIKYAFPACGMGDVNSVVMSLL